jgi:beta-lactamase regulating signal transducer with metallopeptidase domain
MAFANLGSAWMSVVALLLDGGAVGAIARTTSILFAAGLVALAIARASAAARHLAWLVGFVGVLVVAVLSFGGPTIPIPMPLSAASPTSVVRAVVPTADAMGNDGVTWAVASAHPVKVAPRRPTIVPRDLRRVLAGVPLVPVAWLVGVLLVVGRSVFGHLTLARIVARARPLAEPEWQRAIFGAAGAVSLSRPVRLLVSDDVQSPITSGLLRPVVVLPSDAVSWDAERRHIVLVHELAHVARADYASQLVATSVCALFWFNPVVWVAATRLRVEAEHAADDAVLVAGTSGVTYATHLLELARQERSLHLAAAVAVGMIRSTRLEGRFRAMLDSTRPRAGVSPAALTFALLLALVVFIPVGGLRATANAMTSSETITVPVDIAPALPIVRTISGRATVAAVAAIAQAVPELDSTFEKTIAAASGDRLMLDLKTGGDIVLHGWNEPRVRLRARLAGRNWKETRVRLERVGREVRLVADLDGSLTGTSTSHSFELWVPRSTDVEIASAGGGISIDNLNGEITGYSGGGGITIVSSSGSARMTTGGGDVRVSNSDLGGVVTTGGGSVLISDVTGGLRMSSGSGPVVTALPSGTGVGEGATVRGGVGRGIGSTVSGGVASSTTTTTISGSAVRGQSGGGTRGITTTSYNDTRDLGVMSTRGFLSGAMSVTKAGGEIELDEMPRGGVARTGGGHIYIGSSRGLVEVSTGGGDIDLSNMAGDAHVSTGAGDVAVQIVNTDGSEHSVSVFSGKGRVVLELPATLDARLELETAYTENFSRRTRIDSDITLATTETPDWDDRFGTPRKFVRGSATVGSGRGVIRVRTVNGDIVVRRR